MSVSFAAVEEKRFVKWLLVCGKESKPCFMTVDELLVG